jgi:cobalt-zinc-cadmium efflux system outer membrane protein
VIQTVKETLVTVTTLKLIVTATLLFVTVASARAADPKESEPQTKQKRTVERPLGFDELVSEAVENNPEVKFYKAELDAAKAGLRAAGTLENPELESGVGRKSVRGSDLNGEGVAWSVSMMQPFEWPGRVSLRKAVANHDIELAELGLERFRMALAGRVRVLAFGLFAAQEKARASREVAERFRALREVLVQRDPAGITPLLETRVIEATELTMERKASESALQSQAALLELNQLRGKPVSTNLSIGETHLSFRLPVAPEELVTLAGTNNFELRTRAVELAQQGFRVSLARNERFPAIRVGPTYSEERAGDRERIFGFGLSVPLPLWNRNSANIDAAAARQTQAEVSLAVTAREVERKVLGAAITYDTKLKEIRKWRPDSVQHFREAAELADRHYRLGAVPISTYVELQRQYLEAVEGLLDTKKEALEAAQELELLTGLTPSLIITNEETKQK